MKKTDYTSVAEFCLKFGVSRQAVQQRIREKKIKAIRFGTKYLIPNEEVERIEKEGV